MQILYSFIGGVGEETLADRKSKLGHLGCKQSHDEKAEQDGTQRVNGLVQLQLGFRETLLFKQRHTEREVCFMSLFSKRYAK